MRIYSKIMVVVAAVALIIPLTACEAMDNWFSDFEQSYKGLPMTVQTYDFNAQKIDQMEGRSLSITRDREFDQTNEDGKTTSESKVLDITLGGKQITHVGSSMIAYQDGLHNLIDEYPKKVAVANNNPSYPFINRFINSVENVTSGMSKIILIRSQTGKPLATFAANRVSVKSTDVPSSTALLLDGKRLFVYRCDYTIYQQSLLRR
jgi:hypothetical protein